MTDLDEMLRDVTITVNSADRVVRGTLTQHDVRLVVGDFRGRSADDLARAVTRVVRGLITGIEHAVPFQFPTTPPAGTVGDY